MRVNYNLAVSSTVRQAAHNETHAPQSYREFICSKVTLAKDRGVSVASSDIHPILKPHQRDVVEWACRGGRRAIFAAFGLGKTLIQLEIMRQILVREPGKALIVCPLGVRQEFSRDARKLDMTVTFIRTDEESRQAGLLDEARVFLTNYESVREGKINPKNFTVASLDEAAILRSFGGTKTYREFMRGFEDVKYRFVATATPDPNEYIELLAYSAYLGIMDVSQAKTRFFKRDSTKADKLTLHAHHADDFWNWVGSWAIFLQKPSDLGYDDTGYSLPEIEIREHIIEVSDAGGGGRERDGQFKMFRDAATGVSEAAREKRTTLDARVLKMREIVAESPGDHFLLWHDLEAEREAIEDAVPACVSIYGAQPLDERERAVIDFSDGRIQHLAAKPVLAGAGCNFQYHCHRAIFVGIGFKFNDFIQACHRVHRYLQASPVRLDLIYASTEKRIRDVLFAKWARYKLQTEKMSEVIRAYGLSQKENLQAMKRDVTCERAEISEENYRLVCNDSVEEMPSIKDASVGLVLTSIPFSTQYEYSPSYQDFGHTESNAHFFEQMDFLTPHLFRVLQPGRLAVIHVKDRIIPGGLTGLGFQTVYPLHADCIAHYTRHGFGYIGMKTIVTDVVRENNQTYRLGWTEQCKDATRMGVGMPEYLLLFRKPPTSTERSYADLPVVKSKQKYTRGRWQVDAHAFTRSNGNRPLAPEDLDGVPHATIFKMFREFSLKSVYDFERHVRLAESLDEKQRLPVTFMLLQPASWSAEVWSDVARMRTLNMLQARKGRQMHLCPMQFDIAHRVIEQFSMAGETVLDPFSGIGTVPMCAVELGRKAIGVELSRSYFLDGAMYVEMAAQKLKSPSLLDLTEAEHGNASADVP
jgi:DNA modification methylase